MRKAAVKVVGILAVLLVGSSWAFGQAPGGDKPKPASPPAQEAPAQPKAEKPAVPTLEEMLTRALKDNPDIRVADAKVREAEAELNRTRLQVTQKVVAVHKALEAQKGLVDLAEKEFRRVQRLASSQAISHEMADTVQQKLTSAKAKLAEIEAEMPYLLGKPPQPAATNPLAVFQGTRDAMWLDVAAPVWTAPNGQLYKPYVVTDWMKLNPYAAVDYNLIFQAAQPPLPTSMADKIRKALDTQVTVNIQDKPLAEILDAFHKQTGITFQIAQPGSLTDLSQMKLNLHLGDVPLGAALQALEDTVAQLRFTPRDYGILVSWESRLPPGAVRLHDFWKGEPNHPKPAARSANNPPPKDVKGTVRAIDAQAGLVTISVGSNHSLRVGHTLEVYRLDPKPTYLGSIRIVDTQPDQAVAKPVAPLQAGSLQKGDQVSSRIEKR